MALMDVTLPFQALVDTNTSGLLQGQQVFDDKGFKELYKKKFGPQAEPSPPSKETMILYSPSLTNLFFVDLTRKKTVVIVRIKLTNWATNVYMSSVVDIFWFHLVQSSRVDA